MSIDSPNPIDKYRFIHHFVPHEHHKTRAKLLSHKAFFIYTILLGLFWATFKILPAYSPGVLGYASSIEVENLLRYTNERRARIGLKPLVMNQKLSAAAQNKAQDMFSVGYWAHVSPKGTKPWDFIVNAGYEYVYAGENLAKNFQHSKDVVDAWYDSPSHRDNLLNPNYEEIGFAVVNGVLDGYETTLVVQMFGKSKQPSYLASADTNGASVSNTVPQEVAVDVPQDVVKEDTSVVVTEQPQGDVEIIEEYAPVPVAVNIMNEPQDDFIDVRSVTKNLTFVFGGFMASLLGIDLWYTKQRGVLKFTGNTLAHLLFLTLVLMSVLFSVFPGVIL